MSYIPGRRKTYDEISELYHHTRGATMEVLSPSRFLLYINAFPQNINHGEVQVYSNYAIILITEKHNFL